MKNYWVRIIPNKHVNPHEHINIGQINGVGHQWWGGRPGCLGLAGATRRPGRVSGRRDFVVSGRCCRHVSQHHSTLSRYSLRQPLLSRRLPGIYDNFSSVLTGQIPCEWWNGIVHYVIFFRWKLTFYFYKRWRWNGFLVKLGVISYNIVGTLCLGNIIFLWLLWLYFLYTWKLEPPN